MKTLLSYIGAMSGLIGVALLIVTVNIKAGETQPAVNTLTVYDGAHKPVLTATIGEHYLHDGSVLSWEVVDPITGRPLTKVTHAGIRLAPTWSYVITDGR